MQATSLFGGADCALDAASVEIPKAAVQAFHWRSADLQEYTCSDRLQLGLAWFEKMQNLGPVHGFGGCELNGSSVSDLECIADQQRRLTQSSCNLPLRRQKTSCFAGGLPLKILCTLVANNPENSSSIYRITHVCIVSIFFNQFVVLCLLLFLPWLVLPS